MFTNNKKKILAMLSLIVAGLGGGIGIGYALNSCYSSSSATPPTPADLTIINSDIDQKYIINGDTQIHYRSGSNYSSHNKFLNLALYAQENKISSTNYAISGTVDFGILIGFNQSISLYGIDDGKIEVTDSTSTHSCGILIGSVNSSDVPADNGYSGNLIIDHSLDISITNTSANAISVGVEFYTISLGTNQLINGNFNISSAKEARGVDVNGDEFGEITVNGNFIVTGNTSACGVRFGWTIKPYSTQIINGTFQIVASASGSYGYGVYFVLAGTPTGENSSQIINGVFSIRSESGLVFGVLFASVCKSNVVINGLFKITGNTGGTGVSFPSGTESSIYIGGIFTISATQDATGVRFGSSVSGAINIPGYFSISNAGAEHSLSGVWFSGTNASISAAISITGFYCLYCSASSSNAYVNGIRFPSNTASALITGTPKFSSNKAEITSYKSWNSIGGTEEWNGSTGTPTSADTNLNIKSITSGSFSVNVITYTASAPTTPPVFNSGFEIKLYAYYEHLPTSSQLKVDISNILDSSEWDSWGQ